MPAAKIFHIHLCTAPLPLVSHGVRQKDKDDLIEQFLSIVYGREAEHVLPAVLNEYNFDRLLSSDGAAGAGGGGSSALANRDSLFEILGDALVVAPVLRTAAIHAEAARHGRTFVFVLEHATSNSNYPKVGRRGIYRSYHYTYYHVTFTHRTIG